MRFLNLADFPDLRLGQLQAILCVDFTEFTRAIDCAETEFLFRYIIRISYVCLDSDLAQTKPVKCCLVHQLSMRHDFIVSFVVLRGQLMAVVIHPPVRVTLTLPLHCAVLGLRHVALRRKHDALVGFKVCLRSYQIGVHS